MYTPNIRSTYVEMTPELAEKYLATQIINRPVNLAWVSALARTIENNEWVMDGNSIKMDENGHLIDGQHRLKAVLKTGITVPMEVKSGFPPETQEVIDAFSKPRSISDVFSLSGITRNASLTGGIRIYCNEKQGFSPNTPSAKLSPQHALKIYNDDIPLWKESQRIAGAIYYNHRANALPLLSPCQVCGWAAYLIKEHHHSPERVEYFFTQLCSSIESSNVIIEKLRKILLKNKMSLKHYPGEVVRAYIVKTWNAFISGKQVKCLKVTKEEQKVEFI